VSDMYTIGVQLLSLHWEPQH